MVEAKTDDDWMNHIMNHNPERKEIAEAGSKESFPSPQMPRPLGLLEEMADGWSSEPPDISPFSELPRSQGQ